MFIAVAHLLDIMPLIRQRCAYVLVSEEHDHHTCEQIETVLVHRLLEVSVTTRPLAIYVIRALAHKSLSMGECCSLIIKYLTILAEVC